MENGNGIVARDDELQILFNLFGGELTLSYPVYPRFGILRAEAGDGGYDLKLLSQEEDYRRESEKFENYSGEMPSFYDLRDSLLTSGVISHENLEEFEKFANRAINSSSKKVFFCPDTNLLYNNFFSSFGGIEPGNVAIVSTVKDELENKMNSKFKPTEVRLMKQLAEHHGDLLDELGNRRKKESRKASYLAMREYENYSGKEIPARRESSHRSRENDEIIVKSLRDYEKKNPARLVLLTADDPMRDICRAEGLDHFYLKSPHDFDADSCPHDEFLGLVLDLSLVFGFVKLNSAIIFGEFGGKDRAGSLKLRILDEELRQEFRKHQKICRGLSELGIER